MGGVVDGSAVSAAVTNPAFLDANGDDTALGKIDFANAEFASGPTVSNIQREVNSLDSYTGRPSGSAFDAVPTFANSQGFTASQSILARVEAISALFHNSTGHAHSGSAGDGSPIASSSLAGVPLRGYVIQGTDISSVTGSSSDVSSLFTGATASNSPTAPGVVVNTPQNKSVIRQASGTNQNDEYKDLLGNVVYARLTNSGVTWTLSYFVDLAGTETAYSFASSSDVRWYYQQLFNPMLNPPVYSEYATIPSDNVTQDVIDATTTNKGKVLLSSASVQPVGATSSEGTANATVANANHAHQGIHAIQEFSEAVNVFGDIILKGAGSTTITRSGNTFTITAGGGLTPVQESTQAGQSPDGSRVNFDLSYVPYSTDSLLVFLDGLDAPKTLWTLTGSTVTFGTAPAAAQDLKFYYFKSGAVVTAAVTPKTEFRTISSGEATAKALTLIQTPSISSEVTLGIAGGTPQFYGDDYTVSGTTLTWSGLGLDGVLAAGDRLIVGYFY